MRVHTMAQIARKTTAPVSVTRQAAQPSSVTQMHQSAPAQSEATRTRKAKAIRAPEGETKQARFIRLAQLRTHNALKAVRLIGQLSAPQYEWNPEQIQQIVGELDVCLRDVAAKFRRSPRAEKPESRF